MSLILEALRKSEAERRRGHMPDLHAELPPAPAPRVAARPALPWLAIGVTVLAVGFATWWATAARTRAVPISAPGASASPAPVMDEAPPAAPRITHLQAAPKPPPRPTPVASVPTRPTSPAQDFVPPPTHALPPPPAWALPTAEAHAAPAPRAPPPAPPPSSSSNALSLSDLAPAERKALPPLKLSMHMWNDDAAQRFVILDGNRLGEGDRIGDAVVTAITRDGVLLDWNGRALKVPLR